jgi:hypothetical protein
MITSLKYSKTDNLARLQVLASLRMHFLSVEISSHNEQFQ